MFWKMSTLVMISSLCMLGGSTLFKNCQAGEVTLSGSIIDVPCSIDTGSFDQTLDMGVLSTKRILREGQGFSQEFTIKLMNCLLFQINNQLPEWRFFRITFDGRNDNGKFGIEGNAKGVAVQISDRQGNIAAPGIPLPIGQLSSEDMALKYNVQLVSNSQQLQVGGYSSVIRFKIDYY